MNFGRSELRDCLVRRIERQFSAKSHDLVEPSLVIGLFGEWGSGKSYLLKQIGQQFSPQQRADNVDVIVPVHFNPWRFEAEEHLIVPLLLTTQRALTRWQKNAPEDVVKKLGGVLTTAANRLDLLAVAFASAFKFKVGIPGLANFDFDVDKIRKAHNEEQNLRDKEIDDPWFPHELTSLYYDFHHYLDEITGREGDDDSPRLNLLFLIDDIDRCLPERAVQMMEAIKLFLEVEGCAFVLALDDEVVERGILHRYRDYLFQNHHHSNNRGDKAGEEPTHIHGPALHLPPITGTEYMEKMIQLPVRLPLPTEAQVREFLTAKFAALFGVETAETAEQAAIISHKQGRMMAGEEGALLKLFIDAIPPVPRKLVRAAGLLELLIEVAESCGMENLDRLMLARLVILQLFAPEIYRLGRRDPRVFITMANWAASPDDGWLKQHFLQERLKEVNKEIRNSKADPAAIRILESVERPLLQLTAAACQSRSGFDPRHVILGLDNKQLELAQVRRYFSLVDETPVKLNVAVSTTIDQRPAAEIEQPETFFEELFSSREEAWRGALDAEALAGRVIKGMQFDQLLAKWQGLAEEQQRTFLGNDAWLARLFRHLRDAERTRLVEVDTLVKQKQQQLLDETLPLQQRAAAGDLLGTLGDPRPGVGLSADGLPDIAWIEIPIGPFTMGSGENDEDADDNEKPVHTIDLPGYHIARYPITNAQYRPFVESGGYDEERYWSWSEAALAWQRGEDYGLESIKDEDMKKRYRDWLAERSKEKRQQPFWWDDAKWNSPNRPVVGVSWYEAQAYSRWLDEQLHGANAKQRIVLPSEAQWEKAARGEKGNRWPWGDEWQEGLANTKEVGLGETSPVGLFSKGARPYKVEEMAGNVWEWCASRWGPDPFNSQFGYPYNANDGREKEDVAELRLLRGGSCIDFQGYVRSAFRFRGVPGAYGYSLGFRVVLVPLVDSES